MSAAITSRAPIRPGDWTEPTNEELGIQPASGLPLLFLWAGAMALSLGLWAAVLLGGWALLR